MVPGLVGPKPRRISVGDGQQVNIPVQVVVVNSSQCVTGAVYGIQPFKFLGNEDTNKRNSQGISNSR